MGGIAHIDKRKLERDRLAAFLFDRVPMHLNFGRQAVAFGFNSLELAEELREYLIRGDEIAEPKK